MTRTAAAWSAVATAYAPSLDRDANGAFGAMLIRRTLGASLIRCDAFQAGAMTGLEIVFRCEHAHADAADALECAWQARTVLGFACTAPVVWAFTFPPDDDTPWSGDGSVYLPPLPQPR